MNTILNILLVLKETKYFQENPPELLSRFSRFLVQYFRRKSTVWILRINDLKITDKWLYKKAWIHLTILRERIHVKYFFYTKISEIIAIKLKYDKKGHMKYSIYCWDLLNAYSRLFLGLIVTQKNHILVGFFDFALVFSYYSPLQKNCILVPSKISLLLPKGLTSV